jgi:AcrR family transcriptional regulator
VRNRFRGSQLTNLSDMQTPQPDKRARLIQTAAGLSYQRGFRETTLADIAEAARVPLGNVYYYFKTKEELARLSSSGDSGSSEHFGSNWIS